ncbi:MAG: hypothetical protein R3B82_13950 [Sandaracinaceae bacterium]
MSQEREIELDVVFPPPGARSGMVRRPDVPPPPLPALTPPPLPSTARALERLQEDVELVIEATSRRLDAMSQRIEGFERSVRGVLGAQERRIQELEHQLAGSQQRIAALVADLDRVETRAHALHARSAVAMARIEALEHARVLALERAATEAGSELEDAGSRESTQKILRG